MFAPGQLGTKLFFRGENHTVCYSYKRDEYSWETTIILPPCLAGLFQKVYSSAATDSFRVVVTKMQNIS